MQYAINKGKITSGAVLAILARARCDSWGAFARLYDSMVTSTVLYAIPVWGTRYLDQVEKAQMNFYKRLLYLPSNTPNWSLRLELGIVKLAHGAMRMTWIWFVKILKLPAQSLPKKCMLRLIALADSTNGVNQLNWATQFRAFLAQTNCEDLWQTLDPRIWASRCDEVFCRYEQILREEDLGRWRNSAACQLRMPRGLEGQPARYLTLKLPLHMKRIIAQLRLANQYNCKITLKNCVGKLDPHQICQNCNCLEEETLTHLLGRCALYNPLREHYFPQLRYAENKREAVITLLGSNNVQTLKNICYYVEKCLMLRAFSLNE